MTVSYDGQEPLSVFSTRINHLRHQQDDMQITATVSFVQNHDKIMKSAKCIKKYCVHKTCPLSYPLSSTTEVLILMDNLTNYL